MKTFSFTRMLMLSRLQLMEIYGRHPKKNLTIASCAIIALSLLAFIINGRRLDDSMEAAEHMTYIMAAVLSMAFYADLVANRLMVPASNAEKFAALYTNMLLITIISVLLTATVGSAFFSIVSMFIDDADNGAVILFFQKRPQQPVPYLHGAHIHLAHTVRGSKEKIRKGRILVCHCRLYNTDAAARTPSENRCDRRRYGTRTQRMHRRAYAHMLNSLVLHFA